jgi:ABC-2 type transport system ATP-binding protein
MTERASDRQAALRIEGLVKAFHGHLGIGRTVAADGLSLQVEPGEIFGLLGPNGAGKTTTIKVALGLLRPDRGTVRLFGRPPSDPTARARVGFLPENPYFYDYLTGREFLDFYGRLKGIPARERAERVRAAIERVGLRGREKVALRKYSKGMVQRLGLAQAILGDPDLVILDEPMSGLDPVGRREVRDLILGLRDAGKAVFFSSHILQDAELICDRVAILLRGRLKWSGRLERMATREIRWFEVTVLGACPPAPAGELLSASGDETLVRLPDVDALSRFLAAAREAGGQVVSIFPYRQTLEDLFLEEIGNRSPEDGS